LTGPLGSLKGRVSVASSAWWNMSKKQSLRELRVVSGVTVSFAERYAASDQFDQIFRHGMGLVERTASYLDGKGRAEAKALKPPVGVLYATESMRLTTRLLELASWLLIWRGLREGEITREEAQRKRLKLKLQRLTRPSHIRDWAELPESLRGLIEESLTLADRIIGLDKALLRTVPVERSEIVDPVGTQLAMLEQAFGSGLARRA
jgi:regulator of CtrA degradation